MWLTIYLESRQTAPMSYITNRLSPSLPPPTSLSNFQELQPIGQKYQAKNLNFWVFFLVLSILFCLNFFLKNNMFFSWPSLIVYLFPWIWVVTISWFFTFVELLWPHRQGICTLAFLSATIIMPIITCTMSTCSARPWVP